VLHGLLTFDGNEQEKLSLYKSTFILDRACRYIFKKFCP